MEKENINNITEEVLKKIECGEIKMRSRAYFVFKVGVLVFLTFFTFVSSVILVSYILFSMEIGGYMSLLQFGTKGLYKFFILLPWFLLVFNAFLLIFLDYLLRRFRFGYHSPMVYLFLGTLVFVTSLSFFVNYTSFHKQLLMRGEKKAVPIFSSFYGELRKSNKNYGILKGKVISVGDGYLVIRHYSYDIDNGPTEEKVYFGENINLKGLVKVGDDVFIAGDMASGTEIVAYGVKRMASR